MPKIHFNPAYRTKINYASQLKTYYLVPRTFDRGLWSSLNVMAAYGQFLPPPCTVHLQTGWYADMTLTTSLKTSTWIITVVLTAVLAKHEIVPWLWFLREKKHVGTTAGILIVLIFLWFFLSVCVNFEE
jgi:hypothetical protein